MRPLPHCEECERIQRERALERMREDPRMKELARKLKEIDLERTTLRRSS